MDEADAETGIYARESTPLERYVQVGIAQGRVISVSFPTEPADGAASEHPLLDRIDAYLGGAEDDFEDVPVALTIPTAQQRVLERLRDFPADTEVTVAELARSAGLDGGAGDGDDGDQDADGERTVREALSANPVPLLIPDHRVRDGPGATPLDVARALQVIEGR